jgi:hypothetical protein
MTAAKRLAGAVASALILLLVMPAGADAAHRQLELSRDGRHWTSSLKAPLFDPTVRWVPGDRRVAHFWARNTSSDPGRLTIDIKATGADRLIRTGDLTIRARGGGGGSTPVNRPGRHRLLRIESLAPRHRVRVTIAVTLAPSATNVAQAKRLRLAFGARLEQLTRRPRHGTHDVHRGELTPWLVAAGAGPLGVGAALHSLALTRRPKTVTTTTARSLLSQLRGAFRG